MSSKYFQRLSVSVLLSSFLLSLAACGPTPSAASSSKTSTVTQTRRAPSPSLPTISTSCPPDGTGRAAVMKPMHLGTHPTIVYTQLLNFQESNSLTLRRYDVITHHITDILHAEILPVFQVAVVSADGQWVLFAAKIGDQDALQLVRVDGSYLQTLYCTSTEAFIDGNLDWSPDQKFLLFWSAGLNVLNTISLLDLTTGQGQTAYSPPPNSKLYYYPGPWLDNTHVYLGNALQQEDGFVSVALLDLHDAVHQHASIMQITPVGKPYSGFDVSSDKTHLFLATRPLIIFTEPALGGEEHALYTSTMQFSSDITLRTAGPTRLLFIVSTLPKGSRDSSPPSDLLGLWSINTDGTHLFHLVKGIEFFSSTDPRATVSRDGQYYAILQENAGGSGTASLLFGKLEGGQPTVFANGFDSGTIGIAGWTSM